MLRSRVALFLLLALATSGLLEPARATDVSGTITTTTWTKASSPYRVKAEIIVPASNTLTIEPGVDVLFDSNVRFLVQGALNANGTETDSIRFMAGTAPVWNRMRIMAGTADLRYVRISNGRSVAGETDSLGGGMFATGTFTITMDNCVISGNVSEGDGGGLALQGEASATITRSTICDNTAAFNGGGLTVGSGIVFYMSDCLIARNDGGMRGGGISASGQSPQILVQNCTIADNKADSGIGCGVYGEASVFVGTLIALKNCIVWGDIPNTSQVSAPYKGVVNASYSDIKMEVHILTDPTVYPGVGNIAVDPGFFMSYAGDYRLASGSPCIDAGDPATPNDADETRADMGVRPGSGGTLPGTLSLLISTDTTWTKGTGPFHVSYPVVVAAGAMLTIEPGVDVLFDAPVPMVVCGSLKAVGTAEDSIRFLPGLSPVWGGLRFTSGDSSTLSFARVSGVGNAGDGLGGVSVSGSGTRLRGTNIVISGNEGRVACAGGLVSSGALLDLSNSLVCGNRTSGSAGGLGAGSGARLLLDRCGILRNETTSYHHGGGLYLESVTAVITGSTIADNKTAGNSGGIRLIDTDLTLLKCLIVGNTAAYYGGGIWMSDSSTAQIENCTITGNTGTDRNTPAGGIGVWASVATLKNTIVWGNATRDIDTGNGGTTFASYCDLGVTYEGIGNINADPLFVDPGTDRMRLHSTSPCRDTGDPASPLDPDGSRADMGARPFDPTLTVESPGVPLPFLVMQNAPNPFNPSTTIRFTLPEAGHVTLAVYDINGRLVRTLVGRTFLSGQHSVVWDGRDAIGREVASGVYVYRLTAPQGVVTRRMVLLR